MWAYPGPNGKLLYKTTARGDRIIDFSYAGYHGGGVQPPQIASAETVPASGGDDSAAIQAAIDRAAAAYATDHKPRAVTLAPGTFHCSTQLRLSESGVVLRGSGANGSAATVIQMTGGKHTCFEIEGKEHVSVDGTKATAVTDAYVPSGAVSFNVANASGLHAGDTIQIARPVTNTWISFMGMDKLVRNGKKETWLSPNRSITCLRKVAQIDGSRVTVDIPLTDDFDSVFTAPRGVTIAPCTVTGDVSEDGIERIQVQAPAQTDWTTASAGAQMSNCEDCWLRNLAFVNTQSSVSVGYGGRRITIDDVRVEHPNEPAYSSAKPGDIGIDGSQVLVYRCKDQGDNLFYYWSGSGVTGPNVLLDCDFRGTGSIQPHMRWATGVLFDRCTVPNGGIDLINRGVMGSGHGWTSGWSVAWNCTSATIDIRMPPGSENWAVGCTAKPVRSTGMAANGAPGIIDSPNSPVDPSSLYLAQLHERCGQSAWP
jgi:hypothetical protein